MATFFFVKLKVHKVKWIILLACLPFSNNENLNNFTKRYMPTMLDYCMYCTLPPSLHWPAPSVWPSWGGGARCGPGRCTRRQTTACPRCPCWETWRSGWSYRRNLPTDCTPSLTTRVEFFKYFFFLNQIQQYRDMFHCFLSLNWHFTRCAFVHWQTWSSSLLGSGMLSFILQKNREAVCFSIFKADKFRQTNGRPTDL